jgi:quercetin dioxygenase-like cupin family protein
VKERVAFLDSKLQESPTLTTAASEPTTVRIGTDENPLVHPVTGERIVFRKRSRDTGGELLEMTLYLAPSGFIAAQHVHPNQEERFEVSGAAVMFRVAGEERLYHPGEIAVVPPGTPHVWWNPSEEEAATLVQFRPALNTETFFETFFGLAGDGKVGKNGLPNPLHMMVLASEYRREMQLPRPAQTILGPIAMLLAPVGRALGFRGRYDRYRGQTANDAT